MCRGRWRLVLNRRRKCFRHAICMQSLCSALWGSRPRKSIRYDNRYLIHVMIPARLYNVHFNDP